MDGHNVEADRVHKHDAVQREHDEEGKAPVALPHGIEDELVQRRVRARDDDDIVRDPIVAVLVKFAEEDLALGSAR